MAFHVDTSSRVPIYQQLVQQLRATLARGATQPGERLPSVRQLASELVVNPNTIARAYAALESEGLVVTRPGLGIFAALPRVELLKSARDRRLLELLDHWLTEAVHLGYSADEVARLLAERLPQFRWDLPDGNSKKKRSSHGRCDRHSSTH